MRFDWTEYLSLAEELSGKAPTSAPSEAARNRAAISRAYYAAFHAALKKLGGRIPAYDNSHLAIVEYFRHNQSPAFRDIGRDLYRLLSDRRAADYDDDFPRVGWIAPKAVDNARKIIEMIEAL